MKTLDELTQDAADKLTDAIQALIAARAEAHRVACEHGESGPTYAPGLVAYARLARRALTVAEAKARESREGLL